MPIDLDLVYIRQLDLNLRCLVEKGIYCPKFPIKIVKLKL